MSYGFADIDAEAVEVKIIDRKGHQFIYRFGEPGSGRRVHAEAAYNVEYQACTDSWGIPAYPSYPESREFNLKVKL